MVDSIIKRTWVRQSQISEYTDILDIWDSGSHLYERWPDGTENYYKIISREINESTEGFVEVLQKMPEWMMPAQVLHQERRPFVQISPLELEIQGWSVQQEEVQTPSYKDSSRPQAYSKPQAYSRPQAHRHTQSRPQAYTRTQTLPQQQVQRPQVQRPQAQRRPQHQVQRPQAQLQPSVQQM
jgi:hypothetical protein